MANLRAHNERVLATLERGDAVMFKGKLFSHWALYIGDGQVIHLTTINGTSVVSSRGALVRIDDFFDVAADCKASINNSKDERLPVRSEDAIISTAKSMIGEVPFDVLWNNSEHFVSYCRHGISTSYQARKAACAGLLVGSSAPAAVPIGIAIVAGAVNPLLGAVGIGAAIGFGVFNAAMNWISR